jgi:hypothetical protein
MVLLSFGLAWILTYMFSLSGIIFAGLFVAALAFLIGMSIAVGMIAVGMTDWNKRKNPWANGQLVVIILMAMAFLGLCGYAVLDVVADWPAWVLIPISVPLGIGGFLLLTFEGGCSPGPHRILLSGKGRDKAKSDTPEMTGNSESQS